MISFDALAGNNALKNSLKHALNERFPQTVLLSGDDPAALKTLATVLAAGILCEGAGSHPCGNCLPCRKVEQGVHPDLMIVDEGEAELKVDLARSSRRKRIIPNDGERRVSSHSPCAESQSHGAECAAQGAGGAACVCVLHSDRRAAGFAAADRALALH
ncbi:MAG: hypothetical protein ACLRVN_00800 [Butyricicoccus sp.]